ncbi:MAG: FecR domain-containing protein [Desulfobacterales bacterium]|nr:FecR domain-containing protein [Desulfobacterales bacterium]
MKIFNKKSVRILLFAAFLFACIFENNNAYSASLVPEHINISDEFKPGKGKIIGEILQVQGRAVIIHEDALSGYRIKKGFPLYKEDTIITEEKSLVRFKLTDMSILTLASETKLVIRKSIYEPVKEERSGFLNIVMGKALFLIKKLTDFKKSDFKVKTKTAIIGVRGSDFVVIAAKDQTQVIALEKTRLEIAYLEEPDIKTVIDDFKRLTVKTSGISGSPEDVTIQEIQELMNDFAISSRSETVEPSGSKTGASGDLPEKTGEDSGINFVELIENMELSEPEGIEEISVELPENIRKELAPFPAEPHE